MNISALSAPGAHAINRPATTPSAPPPVRRDHDGDHDNDAMESKTVAQTGGTSKGLNILA